MFNSNNFKINSDIDLYKYVTEEDIMEYYYGNFIFNRHLLCPFVKEKTPSFYITTNGEKIRWTRFGMFNDRSHNPIDLVIKLFNLSYNDALNKIYNDIYIDKHFTKNKRELEENKVEISHINIEYDAIFKDFELDYFLQAKIFDETFLIENHVFPVRRSFIKGRLWAKSKKDDPMFVYIHNEKSYTLYRPLAKEPLNKFRKVNITGHIMGYDNIDYTKDHIIITKSYKDYLVLKRLGYNAIAFHTEAISPSEDLLTYLRSKFKIIALLYDNDSTGVKNSTEICKNSNIKNIILTEKDPFEYLCKKDIENLKKEINYGLYK